MTAADQIRDPEVREMIAQARNFLASHTWCHSIESLDVAYSIAGVLLVADAVIVPSADADRRVWVLVGDLPPAYLYRENGSSWQDAVRGYVFEMRRWVEAARTGASVADLIPVNAEPTRAWADDLAGRLEFLDSELLSLPADAYEPDQ